MCEVFGFCQYDGEVAREEVQEDDKMKEALHRSQVGGCMSQGLGRGKAMKVKAQVGRRS